VSPVAQQKPAHVFDCDVHHGWNSDQEVIDYLPRRWREELHPAGRDGQSRPNLSVFRGASLINPDGLHRPSVTGPAMRSSFAPAEGRRPGTDYPTMKAQLLDPHNIHSAILGFNVGLHSGLANPWLAVDVVRAVNDWNRDHWLSIDDDRLRSAVLVQTHLPDQAAAEVRRVAVHPKIAEVLLITSALGQPFGHPVYHAIYDAAAEVGIPVAIHIGGETSGYGHNQAGPSANTLRFEHRGSLRQPIQHHLTSFIAHGVFERFPTLKLVLVECGIEWIPGLLWQLDANYTLMRRESPWVKKLPSEYFREHVRITTQPLGDIPTSKMVKLFATYEGLEDVLCFSTDYPHWDTDEVEFISKRLPKEWLGKVMFQNALALYGPGPAQSSQPERAPALT